MINFPLHLIHSSFYIMVSVYYKEKLYWEYWELQLSVCIRIGILNAVRNYAGLAKFQTWDFL